MNPVLRHIAAHRTIRSFHPTALADDVIARAVSAAQHAATSSWIQGYSLLQITDPAVRKELRRLTGDQAQVEQAGAFFCVCGDTRRHRLIAQRESAGYVSNLETFLLATIDASLFAQNLTLAFESLGYGCCYIGGLRSRLAEVDELLELPEGVLPLFGLCAGEIRDDTGQRPRLPLDAVWMKDNYASDATMLAAIERHDVEAASYYDERGQGGRTWSGGVYRKFTQPQRAQLFDFYQSKGERLR
jgi:FMN reductase (NADPH)